MALYGAVGKKSSLSCVCMFVILHVVNISRDFMCDVIYDHSTAKPPVEKEDIVNFEKMKTTCNQSGVEKKKEPKAKYVRTATSVA